MYTHTAVHGYTILNLTHCLIAVPFRRVYSYTHTHIDVKSLAPPSVGVESSARAEVSCGRDSTRTIESSRQIEKRDKVDTEKMGAQKIQYKENVKRHYQRRIR